MQEGEAVADAQAGLAEVPRDDYPDCMALSPDGRLIAAGGHIRDLASGTLVQALAGFGSGFCSITFSPDGRTLASGEESGGVPLWDSVRGVPVWTPGR